MYFPIVKALLNATGSFKLLWTNLVTSNKQQINYLLNVYSLVITQKHIHKISRIAAWTQNVCNNVQSRYMLSSTSHCPAKQKV